MPRCFLVKGQRVITTKANRCKLLSNVPTVSLDGVSFHSEESVHNGNMLCNDE